MANASVARNVNQGSLFEIFRIKANVYKSELKAGIESGIYLSDVKDIDSMSYCELEREYQNMVRNIRKGIRG